jgi:hypothetical protein
MTGSAERKTIPSRDGCWVLASMESLLPSPRKLDVIVLSVFGYCIWR